MKRISSVMENLLKGMSAEWILDSMKILRLSENVLKDYGCDAVWFENGILFVWSSKPEKRFELNSKKSKVISAINSLIGEDKVKDVKFKRKIWKFHDKRDGGIV